MPSKDDEAPADNQRSVRRQHLCKHLHAAGPRPTLEALIAVENGQLLDDVLEGFAVSEQLLSHRRCQLLRPNTFHFHEV